MNTRLRIALLLTLAATVGTALWPEGEAVTVDAAVAPAARRVETAGDGAGPSQPARPADGRPAHSADPGRAVASTSHGTRSPAGLAAARFPDAADAVERPPARDWPAPTPAGLEAWQAQRPLDAPAPVAPAASPRQARVPAPVAASAVTEDAPRHAPPLPYQWVGVYDDGPSPQALLAGRVRSVNVRVGQIVDRDWRLEAIASGRLDWTWLPGNLPVTQRAGLQAAPLTSDLP